MTIFTKRNAVVGWLTWLVGKRVVKRRARAAVPAVEGGKPNRPAVAAALAAIGGALLFWRRRARSEQPTSP
jgi:hypothetical protein